MFKFEDTTVTTDTSALAPVPHGDPSTIAPSDGALPEDVSSDPEMNQYFYAFALVPILDIIAGKINYDYWNSLSNTSWIQVYMDEFEVGTVGLISAALAIVFCEQWDWVHDV